MFYQCVMGGGGHDIHFGIYKSPTDGVKESSDYTTEWMMTQMEWAKPIDANCHVLDLDPDTAAARTPWPSAGVAR